MLKIRLRRTGAIQKPQYRVVVVESTTPRDGAFVEIIGTYNPLTNPETFKVDGEKVKYWISKGAQPSDTVKRLLTKAQII